MMILELYRGASREEEKVSTRYGSFHAFSVHELITDEGWVSVAETKKARLTT